MGVQPQCNNYITTVTGCSNEDIGACTTDGVGNWYKVVERIEFDTMCSGSWFCAIEVYSS